MSEDRPEKTGEQSPEEATRASSRAGILRSAGALAEDCERGARGAARAASQRGGRVAQAAAELAALLPDG